MRSSYTASHRGGSGVPVVLLHGFMDTWRSWDLVRPQLEREFDVLAPTLAGHAGGPALSATDSELVIVDAVEAAMDEAGFETAHVVGNSLGGYVAMHLAERGRARSVTALAPAGGWEGGPSFDHAVRLFRRMQRNLAIAAPLAPLATRFRAGRRYASRDIAVRHDHLARELLVHMARGARACPMAKDLLARRDEVQWRVDPQLVTCPVRIVWGRDDRVLLYPDASQAFRRWLPDAEWIELDGVGHCPQLDVPAEVVRLVRDQVTAAERAISRGSA